VKVMSRVRISVTLDPEVASWLEKRHNEAIQKAIAERVMKPSFSSFLNDLLKEVMERERLEGRP